MKKAAAVDIGELRQQVTPLLQQKKFDAALLLLEDRKLSGSPEVKALRSQIEEEALSAIESIKEQARRAESSGNFDEARRLLTEAPLTGMAALDSVRKDEISAVTARQFAIYEQRAKPFIEQRRFGEVLKIYQAALGIPEITQSAQREINTFTALKEQDEQMATEKFDELLTEMIERIEPLAKKGSYSLAQKILDEWMERPESISFQEQIKKLKTCLSQASSILEHATLGLNTQKGKDFVYGRARTKIVRADVEKQTLYLTAEGAEIAVPVSRLSGDDQVKYASSSLDELNGKDQLKLAFFWIFRGDYLQGATAMSRAQKAGEATDEYLILFPALSKASSANFTQERQRLDAVGLDVVIVFDSTGSMTRAIENVQKGIDGMLIKIFKLVPNSRIGMVTYRDRGEAYVTKSAPITSLAEDRTGIRDWLFKVRADGGGDLPEAVDKGLDAAINMEWRRAARKVILVFGDAEPHPSSADYIQRRATYFRGQGGRISTIVTDLGGPATGPFRKIAESGGGEAISIASASELSQKLTVLTFGSRWKDDIASAK